MTTLCQCCDLAIRLQRQQTEQNREGERKAVGARERERESERDGEKPFMIKTARSQCDKLGDDTSHSTTKGENIGWGPFTEKLMRSSLKELSL